MAPEQRERAVGDPDVLIDRLAVRARVAVDRILGHTLALHLISLVLAAAVLVHAGRRQWFFNDDWDPIAQRTVGGGGGAMGWLDGHGEHPFLMPTLLWRGLVNVFGIDSYLPYVLMAIAAQLLLTHLLWRLMLAVDIRPLVATVAAALFAVCGAAYENLLWAFQVSLIMSVVCGVGALLLLPQAGAPGQRVGPPGQRVGPMGWRDWLATALGVSAWMFSGVGLPIIVMVAGTSMLRRRWVAGSVQLVVPAATYGIWVLRYGGDALDRGQTLEQGVRSIPEFTLSGLVHAYGAAVGSLALGPVVLAAVAGGLVVVCRRPLGRVLPVVTMFSAAALFLALTAIRRSDLGGFDNGGGSRYFHIVLALGLPAMALVVDRALRARPMTIPVVVAVAMLAIVQVDTLMDNATVWAERSGPSRDKVLAAAELAHQDAVLFPAPVEPQWAPGLWVDDLESLVAEGLLTPRPTSEATLLEQQNALQVAVLDPADPVVGDLSSGSTSPLGATLLGTTGVVATVSGAGCRDLVASQAAGTVTLSVDSPTALQLDAPNDVAIVVQTTTGPSGGAISTARDLVLPAGSSALGLAAPGRTVVLTLPAGASFDLCGLSDA